MATPKDTHLYDVLHVTPKASPKAIKAAYHRLALTHHPDRFIDANADVLAKFQQITEAYGVLRDPEQKKLYDEQGFRAAIGRDPERAVESPNDKGKDAKELYGLYERDFDRDDDLEMDDLLEWWTSGEPAKLDAKAGLRTDAETFYGQLCDAFDQFRLTHAATTNDDPRSKTATPACLNFVEKHFGKANKNVLNEWQGNSNLEPNNDGKYFAENGRQIDVPNVEKKFEVPEPVQAVHVRFTGEFEQLLNPTTSETALGILSRVHSKRYAEALEGVRKRDSHGGAGYRAFLGGFKTEIDWEDIDRLLKELGKKADDYNQTKDYTTLNLSKLPWEQCCQQFGFPPAWQAKVQKHIIEKADIKFVQAKSRYQQASVEDANEDGEPRGDGKQEPPVPPGSSSDKTETQQADGKSEEHSEVPQEEEGTQFANRDDDGDVAMGGVSPQIRYKDGRNLSCKGWKNSRGGIYIFAVLHEVKGMEFCDIMNGKLFPASLNQLTSPDMKLDGRRKDASWLRQTDFHQLEWKAIAMRDLQDCVDEIRDSYETWIFVEMKVRRTNGIETETGMVSKTDMRTAYTKKQVDDAIWEKLGWVPRTPNPDDALELAAGNGGDLRTGIPGQTSTQGEGLLTGPRLLSNQPAQEHDNRDIYAAIQKGRSAKSGLADKASGKIAPRTLTQDEMIEALKNMYEAFLLTSIRP